MSQTLTEARQRLGLACDKGRAREATLPPSGLMAPGTLCHSAPSAGLREGVFVSTPFFQNPNHERQRGRSERQGTTLYDMVLRSDCRLFLQLRSMWERIPREWISFDK